MTLVLIFMAALCSTLLLSSVVDWYVKHKVEPQMKMSQSIPETLKELSRKWDTCYILFCAIIIIGGTFTLITSIAIIYSFARFVFSLT